MFLLKIVIIVTIFTLFRLGARYHNKQPIVQKYDFLRVKWEPYIVATGLSFLTLYWR